jgi:DNA primase
MDEPQCLAFLKALNAHHIKSKDSGWMTASCPLAPWTHQNQKDTTPSFALSIKPGERSYFVCFACRQGSAEELLQALELYTSKSTVPHLYNFALARQILTDEVYVVPLPAYGERVTNATTFEEWPAYWIESFPPTTVVAEAHVYLEQRGITAERATAHGLRYDAKRHMVVCPYVDVFQRFAGARGRSILLDVQGPAKHFDYTFKGRNNARLVWYNEQVLNLRGPVVVVEGQFDCMRVEQAYPKVVAALTAKPSWEKAKKLSDSPFVIQIPDRDETGRLSTETYARFCSALGIRHKVLWLDEGVKDPAECSVEYLSDRITELL